MLFWGLETGPLDYLLEMYLRVDITVASALSDDRKSCITFTSDPDSDGGAGGGGVQLVCLPTVNGLVLVTCISSLCFLICNTQ